MNCEAIVIGGSAGGLQALGQILPALPVNCPPVAVVQHLPANVDTPWAQRFKNITHLTVKEAEEKEPLKRGHVYMAPSGYHLLVEFDHTFSLSYDERVNFSRPSIDILFETAAQAFCSKLVGVILTGASHDGAAGLAAVKAFGGRTIIQDPLTAEVDIMPLSALNVSDPDHVLPLAEIGSFLGHICFEA